MTMNKKGLALVSAVLMVALLLVAVLPVAAEASPAPTDLDQQPLAQLLSRVPEAAFGWDYLSFIDYTALPDRMAWSAGFDKMAMAFMFEDKLLASSGFALLDVRASAQMGLPPFDQVWLGGQFEPERIKEALAAKGYHALDAGGAALPVWTPDGNINAGRDMDMAQRDPAFLFGGDLGMRWPLSFDDSLIVAGRDANKARLAAAQKGPMLADDARLSSLLKALAQPVEQLVMMSQDMVSLNVPDKPGLLALAQVTDGGTPMIMIALSYADEAAAKTAEARLSKSLPAATLATRKGVSLMTVLDKAGGKADALRTVADADGPAWLVIPFRFEKSGDAAPDQGRPFRLFYQMMMQRDMAWLFE